MSEKGRKQIATELFNKAYNESYTSIYKFCYSKLKDSHMAEDCVQEAFLILYNRLLDGEEIIHTKAFLLKTANNFVMKRFEDVRKAYTSISLDDVITIPSQNEDVDDRLTFEQYSRQISAALSDRDAEMFSMRYIEKLSLEVMAERYDMSITAVTTKLSRIRNKLKPLFEDCFK